MKFTPRLVRVAVFALSVALIAGSAMAQPGGGRAPGMGGPGMGGPGGMRGPGGMGGFGGGGVIGLLRTELMQTELGIDKATVEKAEGVVRTAMEEGRASFEGLRDLSEEQRRAKFEEMRTQMQERMKDLEKKIAEVIGMEKFGRLKEIELQMSGVEGISRPEVSAFLGLTDAQKEKIDELRQANREKAREKMGAIFSGNFREMSEEERTASREKMETLRKELQTELETGVMGQITDDQKAKLGQMMGEPFAKMEELREQLRASFFGGGRGPEGRGGDRGNRGDRGGERGGERGSRGEGRPQRPT